jgi:hypothetical protein
MSFALASGIFSYVELQPIIDAIINTEGRRYPIPGMERADIAQEIRLECLRVMQFYDATRIGNSPYKFLQVCVKNFLYNMRRGIYVPNNPPCVRCPLWDKVRRTCVIDEIGCEPILKYRNNMATKAALRAPATLEIDVTQGEGLDIDAWILDESIRAALPSSYLKYYQAMKDGRGDAIPPRIKRQIRNIVKEILGDA